MPPSMDLNGQRQNVAQKEPLPTPAPTALDHLLESTEMSLAAEADAAESVEEFRS